MAPMLSTLMNWLQKAILLVVLAGFINLPGWVSAPHSFASTTYDVRLTEIQRDQSMSDRQEAYEEAKEIASDPKRGLEKEYEEEMAEYRAEHPDEGGLLEGAKELVTKVTGSEPK